MFERGAGFSAGVDAEDELPDDEPRSRIPEAGWAGAGSSDDGGGAIGPGAACARERVGAAAQSTPSNPQKISEQFLFEGVEFLFE